MKITEYIRKFKQFIANERFRKAWLEELAKEEHSKAFTKELKRKVKDRDGWCCQECGIKARQLRQINGAHLTVHHINFDHSDCRMSNLITLCPLCHCKTNFVKSSWIKYYTEKVEMAYVDWKQEKEEKKLEMKLEKKREKKK